MNESKNTRKFPFAMTKRALITYIITTILIGLYMFFIRGDLAGKMSACIACPCIILYLIYAYCKERKADKNANLNKTRFMDGSYFESASWHEEYVKYLNEHPFEKPVYSSMKKDLLKRYHRREYIAGMILPLFLLGCSVCLIPMRKYSTSAIGICLFSFLFWLQFSLYIGMPVRRWLKKDIDYMKLEYSYINSQMIWYKTNGLAFGTTHIHAFTENKIFAIDYELVDGISRKIVRLKKYEDGIYNTEEYQHFAVIHARLPQGETTYDVEIELNEFQVQMAIDRIATYKLGDEIYRTLTMDNKNENENV